MKKYKVVVTVTSQRDGTNNSYSVTVEAPTAEAAIFFFEKEHIHGEIIRLPTEDGMRVIRKSHVIDYYAAVTEH